MDKHLHIICLNVPYPVDYGGVFDLFYKLPALQQQGVKIHLHCFDYGRGQQPALNKYCESVHYYSRKTGLSGFSFHEPYIVSSRRNEELFSALLQDNYPILMEGVHCTALLNDRRFAQRKCFVRLHNVEHIYYRNLSRYSASFFHKLYYLWESKLLNCYENAIETKAAFWSVTEKDADVYRHLGATNIRHLPLFLPQWNVSGKQGKGSYCLYQGDLSVAENEQAALWLVNEVFTATEHPLIIAGKNPPSHLQRVLKGKANVTLIANPLQEQMQQLIANAHINIIPSFNTTGIKLKVLNALYNGRHCLANSITVEGTGLEAACAIAETPVEFLQIINELFAKPFTDADIQLRERLLGNMFNNDRNAKQLVHSIWGNGDNL